MGPSTIGTRKTSVIIERTKNVSLRKSLSYNDLANEIANLFSKPKKNSNFVANPRKTSNNRRQSKTFRRTPTIIIHPPTEESLDRFTNSCPDIQRLLSQENIANETCKNELNYSCPDINALESRSPSPNLKFNNFSRSCPDINTLFEKNTNQMQERPVLKKQLSIDSDISEYEDDYQKIGTSFARCMYEMDMLKDEVNDIKNECECLLMECSCQDRDYTITHYNTPVYKNTLKILPTKHLEPGFSSKINRKISFSNIPYSRSSDSLHGAYARTSSEPNLFKNLPPKAYNRSCSDVEYFYKRPNTLSVNKTTETAEKVRKKPKKHDISPTDILRNKMKQSLSMFDLNAAKNEDSYDTYHTIHGGMKLPKHLTEFSLKNYKGRSDNFDVGGSVSGSWAGPKNFDNDDLLALVKCCCGRVDCDRGNLSVVPITFEKLLEANLCVNMVRLFFFLFFRSWYKGILTLFI